MKGFLFLILFVLFLLFMPREQCVERKPFYIGTECLSAQGTKCTKMGPAPTFFQILTKGQM